MHDDSNTCWATLGSFPTTETQLTSVIVSPSNSFPQHGPPSTTARTCFVQLKKKDEIVRNQNTVRFASNVNPRQSRVLDIAHVIETDGYEKNRSGGPGRGCLGLPPTHMTNIADSMIRPICKLCIS